MAFPHPITTIVPKRFHKIRIVDQSLDYAIAHSTPNPITIQHEFPLEDPTRVLTLETSNMLSHKLKNSELNYSWNKSH
jgi:hypothetical protein